MTEAPKSLAELFREAATRLEFEVESAKLHFTDEMLAVMAENGISRTKLAARLGVKPARVTALLRGDNNFTLETMIRICRALGVKYSHHLAEKGCSTHWFDVPFTDERETMFEAEGHVATQSVVIPFPKVRSDDEFSLESESTLPTNVREIALVS